ncbi:MAG: DUF4157 domain-containing protein [Anaerolineae bacterium]
MATRLIRLTTLWLSERLYDAAMWPINLIRDFPVRLARLGHTMWRGLTGIPHTFLRANSAGDGRTSIPGRAAGWLHQLLAQLFDLAGGPELAQLLMHLITHTTPLSGREIAMIASVLGETALRFSEVRVAEGGLLALVFRLNGNLAFATWHTIYLPQSGRHTRRNLPIMVHELTHVYQYERVGSRYLGEAVYMLMKTKRDCYDYGSAAGLRTAHEAGKHFCDFNREQQAMIVQDYFTLKQHGADVTAYEPFMSQLRAGEV